MRPEGDTGVQTHFSAVRQLLQKAGVPVRLVTPFSAPATLFYPVFGVRKLLDPLSGTASVWWYEYWHEYFLRRALRDNLRNRPAVIYAQCPPSARAAIRARSGPHQKVVMVVHFNVSQADEWVSKGKLVPGTGLYQAIRQREQEILPQLDGIVFLSDFVRENLLQTVAGLEQVPSLSIPNFIQPATATADGPQGDLINIGTLEPRKNQQFLLQVLAAANRLGRCYRLTLVGDGPDRLALTRLADELGVAPQVTFGGRRLAAARFIPAHRAYVHSARMENMPIALIEALSCGVPVLAAPVGGIPEVFRDEIEGRYWALDDPVAGAEKLIAVLENPARYAAMRTAARRRFDSEFTEEVVGHRLRRFLTEIAKEMEFKRE